MIRAALIGAGKMGISHLSILGAHPDVEIVGVCDTAKMVTDVLEKYSGFTCFSEYTKMIDQANPEAVFVAVPTKFHYSFVKALLLQKKHVFVEKPFCLKEDEGRELVDLAAKQGVINQVGYHNQFVGTFNEVKRLIDGGFLGEIQHFTGEAYGPVVVRAKQETWRSSPSEGGGCLMDYASHVIDLINYILGPITKVKSSILKSFYSKNVEDGVFSLLEVSPNVTGVLSVNWSDDTYRKMSTTITVIGTKGKIISDSNALKVYFKEAECPAGYSKGWNVKYITDFAEEVDFYLRGEEYSLQVDHFIKAIQNKVPNKTNNFKSAWHTDKVISLIKESALN